MEALAYALVCDDLRFEMNGKPFMIGMYGDDMIFESLPATVPQLIAAVHVFSPIQSPILQFTVTVTCPGTEISENFDMGPMPPITFPDPERLEAAVVMAMRPLQVDGPGILKIMIKHANGELRARRIRIKLLSEVTTAAPTSTTA